jgi:hypothetical protein
MPYLSTKEVAKALLDTYAETKSTRNPKIVLLAAEQLRELAGRKQLRGAVLSAVQGMFERRQMYLLRARDLYLIVPFGAPTTLSSTASAVRKVVARRAAR